MEYFKLFIIENFVLMCISLVMIVNALQRYREHPKLSKYTVLIISAALFLAVAGLFQNLAQYVWASIPLTTIFSVLGYVFRPVCLYFFILLSLKRTDGKLFFLTWIPLVINILIYVFAFIPATKEFVVVYILDTVDNSIYFGGGPLRFASHIISLGYLLWLIYCSTSQLKAKHFNHAIVLIVCALFVIMAVVIETFFNDAGDIHLLNTTIGVSAITYYLYLHIEKSQVDMLSGLFNRESFFSDIVKMEKSVTGVIQFDMNGLKFINDNYGHIEGDKALMTISDCILKSAKGNMYAYRLGGDEFIVLANKKTEEEIVNAIEKFKANLSKTNYHCSVGYAFKKEGTETISELIKESEKMMYKDKEEFYKNSKFERRKALHS